jgi:hypothetical protein
MSEFNKQVGKVIDKTKEEKLKNNWKKTKIITQSSFVGSDIIYQLLSTQGAVGLRIFYGMDDEGNVQPIFSACDDSGNPIGSTTTEAKTEYQAADATLSCPPYCPK